MVRKFPGNLMTEKYSLNQIWIRGCKGEDLSTPDFEHFKGLARSRFHTFNMSASHAKQERSEGEAESWINGLVAGLVRELKESPGLERQWYQSEFTNFYYGQLVNLALSKVG